MRLCANYTTSDLLEFSTWSEAAVEARAGDCGVCFKRDFKGVMVDIKNEIYTSTAGTTVFHARGIAPATWSLSLEGYVIIT